MIKSRNIFLLFLLFLLVLGCKKKQQRLDEEKFAFGTFFKISVFSENNSNSKKSIEKSFEEIKRIDNSYNSKVKDSLFFNLNKSKKEKINEEATYLFKKIEETYNLSNKKYDITMEPLMTVWGFSEEVEPREKLPTNFELEQAAKNVDFSKIIVEKGVIFIQKNGVKIDTGSFLKGYAVKKASEKLRSLGVKSGFVSAISSIEAIGLKGDGSPWRIGIQNPNNPSEIIGTVELANQSMGVSGDYQTYVEINGEKFHHIIDKKTKYPVKDKKMVVVVNKDSFEADLYSTAFFLMPIEKVLEKVSNTPNLDVLIVDENNRIIVSENLKFNKK
ncbi:MAG: FAD:protein FMN transferase [Cetobacterium sp.]